MQQWGSLHLKFCIALLAAAAALAIAAPVRAETRLALVIGNNSYPNLPAEKQLQKAVNDAQAVGDTLARLGFEVIRASNVGRQAMIDKIADLTGRIGPGDIVAFFFAGHGVGIGGANYLLPGDVPAITDGSEVRIRGASISEADIIQEIGAKRPRVAFLTLDACRDNPFPRVALRSAGDLRGLAAHEPAHGVFVIYSAGFGQSALDRLERNDPNPNSVFTRVFVTQLAKPGLDLSSLAIDVRESVADLALTAKDDRGQPTPYEQTPAYYDETLGGRIYLAGLPKLANPPPPTAAGPGGLVATPAAFAVDGYVMERVVNVGSVVRAGDLLARLDPRVYSAQVAQAQAQIAAVRAAVAQAIVQEAKSRNLLAARTITNPQYLQAKSDLQQQQAELAKFQVQLENAMLQLQFTELRAAFDGIVTTIRLDPGMMVRAGDMAVQITHMPAPDSAAPATGK
jgi:hypothetical protein